jgi:aspartyl-tRNA(Asn)/glutamyl-tRNA(Gln) amidotransferase subunit B
MRLQPVIGLEIHIQMKTKSKMFCGCDNRGENAPPNTTVCPVCMGHPGVLPTLNNQALRWGVLVGLALGCEIPAFSKFDRKNYFYPDLPKGYQISQFDLPIAINGHVNLEIPGKNVPRNEARIGITRAHLEEDAAKLQHAADHKASFVDFNRSSTPLIEIVTEPDFLTPFEAKTFLQELRRIARYLKVSDADMEKGHLRCDANISMRHINDDGTPVHEALNPKTEVKNINSFKSVERALEYEIKRQTKMFELGSPPAVSSTRGWDDDRGTTKEQRIKEEAYDYRYFPEPDIPPLDLTEIAEEMRSKLPELPAKRRYRFIDEYGLTPADVRILTDDPAWADYTEQVFSELHAWLQTSGEEGSTDEIKEKNKAKLAKLVGGWLTSKLMGAMSERSIDIRILKITAENFAEFITLVYTNKVNSTTAREILGVMLESGQDPSHVMEDRGLGQMEDESELREVVGRILEQNPHEVERLRAGENKLMKFLVGMVMKATEGRANPEATQALIKNLIS